jgi:hypothetical protein
MRMRYYGGRGIRCFARAEKGISSADSVGAVKLDSVNTSFTVYWAVYMQFRRLYSLLLFMH